MEQRRFGNTDLMTSAIGFGTPTPLTGARRRELVESIHASPALLVLAVAGGGNAIITDLLNVPGASRTVLEVIVPYAAASMEALLGGPAPVGAVSAETATAMAEACLRRAETLVATTERAGGSLLGVACTAALVSDRIKKGDHRAHLAIAIAPRPGANGPSSPEVTHQLIELKKGRLDRTAEDRLIADALLVALASRAASTAL